MSRYNVLNVRKIVANMTTYPTTRLTIARPIAIP
jgi:hypothetical protein